MFGKKQKSLLLCEIIHDLLGRVRIRCRALTYLAAHAEEMVERLENMQEVISARVSSYTTNILVYYDPALTTSEQIRETAESIISSYSLVAYKTERKEKVESTVQERRLQEDPVSELVTRVAVTTVSLVFSFFRGSQASSLPLWRRFTTMSALTSLSLAGPIMKSGLESLRNNGRPNADTLSATAIIASLISGNDISALTIIWLADIAELLTAYTMDRTRNAIHNMLDVGEEFVWRVTEAGLEQRVPPGRTA